MKKFIFSLMVVLTGTVALAKPEHFPATSPDGLVLMSQKELRAVYMKPGADLSQYDKIALLDTYVSFAKNWERDYNESASFENRVSDKDMQQIRDNVAKEFAKEMVKVLSTEDGRPLVTTGGTGVLIGPRY